VISVHVRCTRGTAHDRVQFFFGPDADHRASAGWLTMRREETVALWHLLGASPRPGETPADIEAEVTG
jgi:hypothetical protein